MTNRVALDSSAIVAILTREAGWEALDEYLDEVIEIFIGAPTLVEASIVLICRTGPEAIQDLLAFTARMDCRIVEFSSVHWMEAAEAFVRYGKGRHRAALNYGDCQAYAIARVAGCPLLYKGNDFSQTDLPKLQELGF